MRETLLTLAAATLCAAFLQVVDAHTRPAPAGHLPPPLHGGPPPAP